MRTGLAVILLSVVPAWSQAAKPASAALPKLPPPVRATLVPASSMRELERFFNNKLAGLVRDVDNPAELMGDTRGVHVQPGWRNY